MRVLRDEAVSITVSATDRIKSEVQEEISSLFDDLYEGMEEAWKLLRKLEHHALPILTRSDMEEQSVINVQNQVNERPFTWDLPEPSDQELPFADT